MVLSFYETVNIFEYSKHPVLLSNNTDYEFVTEVHCMLRSNKKLTVHEVSRRRTGYFECNNQFLFPLDLYFVVCSA